jgi:uncharacterized membrane protein
MRCPRFVSISCIVAAALLFSGLRFFRLDQKLYWVDEVATSTHVTGQKDALLSVQLERLRPTQLGQVQKLLILSPKASMTGTIRSLRENDPHHTPLYYLLLNRWAWGFGLAPARLRLLSSLFSFLSLFAIAWLAFELFESKTIAAMSALVFAASPFELIYAQQAREYSFWVLLILVTTGIFLKLMRRPTWLLAIAYAVFSSALLYTHLFSIWILVAHGCAAIILFRNRRKLLIYAAAILTALLLFTPWVAVLRTRLSQVRDLNSGVSETLSPTLYLETFVLNLVRPVLDLDLPSYQHLPYREARILVPLLVILILVVASIALFAIRASALQRTVLFALGLWNIVPLVALDAVAGGRRALLPRYDSASWIVLHLVVAFACVYGFESRKRALQIGSALAIATMLLAGIITDRLYFLHRTWWTTRPSDLAQTADFLDSQQESLELIVDEEQFSTFSLVSLSYFLRDMPLVLVRNDISIRDFSPGTAFVLQPTSELVSLIQSRTGQICVPIEPWLCRLEIPERAGQPTGPSPD